MPNLLRLRGREAEQAIEAAVKAERVRLLYQQLPMSLALSVAVMPLIALMLWKILPEPLVIFWMAAIALVTLGRALILTRFRSIPDDARHHSRWLLPHLIGTGLAGLTTGTAGLITLAQGDGTTLSFVLVVFAGLGAGALSTNGASLATTNLYLGSLVMPTGVGLLFEPALWQRLLGILALIFLLGSSLAARRYNRVLVESLWTRFRKHSLYRQMVRANHLARETAKALQEQIVQREQVERHLGAVAERWQKANLALQGEIEERARNELLVAQQAISILEGEERMGAVVENAFDAIITCAADGTILSTNPAAQTLFAAGRQALDKRRLQELVPNLDELATTHQVVELQGLRLDGRGVPLALSVNAMRVGREVQFVCILRDETQSQLSRRALIDAKNAAEAANRAKSEFLSAMSHELRTPLNAILGFAQLLQTDPMDPLSPGQQESLEHIAQGGWHLLKLINDILDLAKIEAGRMETRMEEVPLGEVIKESLHLVAADAERRQVRVHDRASDSPLILRADRVRLKQVLLNLLSNAVKYNWPQGEVFLEQPQLLDQRCRLTITNTGEGLTPEQIDKIFAPFTRVASNKEEIEGTGIGLSITRNLVHMMNGAIGAASEPGQCSQFWIELPLADTQLDTYPAGGAAIPAAPAAEPAGRWRVLYVEDNPANRQLMQGLLRRHRPHIQLSCATDGPLGLELARQIRPHLILLDISLPGMSGFEVLEKLRDDPGTQDIPALALSANAMPQNVEEGLEAGFLNYLTKPIDLHQVLNALDALLPHPGQQQQPRHAPH